MKKCISIFLLLIIMSLSCVIAFAKPKTTYKNWVEFGSYPQTQVNDVDTIRELKKMESSLIWTPLDEIADYSDISLNGTKYRAVIIHKEKAQETMWEIHYETIYWYKYEPVYWAVLNKDTGYALCSKAIDAVAFGTDETQNNYRDSILRVFLNDIFYNTAFSKSEQALIKEHSNDNKAYCVEALDFEQDNTVDNVFAPSYQELFTDGHAAKREQYSHYAEIRSHIYKNETLSAYWLRNGGSSITNACIVHSVGSNASIGEGYVTWVHAVVPAVYLDKSVYTVPVETSSEESLTEPTSAPTTNPTTEPTKPTTTEPTTRPTTTQSTTADTTQSSTAIITSTTSTTTPNTTTTNTKVPNISLLETTSSIQTLNEIATESKKQETSISSEIPNTGSASVFFVAFCFFVSCLCLVCLVITKRAHYTFK